MASKTETIYFGEYKYGVYYSQAKRGYIADFRPNVPITPEDFKNGKKHRKTLQSKKKSIAKEKMNDYLKKLPKQGESYEALISLNDAFQKYKYYKYTKLKPSSLDRLESTFNTYIKPAIGNKKLKDIESNDIQNIIDDNNKSRSTLKKIKYCMTSLFNYFVKILQVLDYNPATSVYITNTKVAKEREIYHEDEIKAIMNVAFSKKPNGEYLFRHAPVVLLLLETGIRAGEAVALKWSNINIYQGDEKYIKIEHSLSYSYERDENANKLNRKLLELTPKSQQSIRDIPLTKDALYALKILKQEQEQLKIKSDYILAKKDGTPIKPTTLLQCFKRILSKAGIKYRTLHSTRHTAATGLIYDNKMTIALVGNFLGQSTRATTEAYIHGTRGHIMEAFKSVDNNRRINNN